MEILITIAVWIGCGFLCEYLGNQKGQTHCFWYGFLLGVLGIIIVLCLRDKTKDPDYVDPNATFSNSSGDKYEEIAKLQKLKESGAITDVEFEIEKQKLLR